MKQQWLINVILVALVAGLALLLMLKPGKQDEIGATLTDISSDSINRLRIQRPQHANIVISKQDGVWLMAEPIKARANAILSKDLARLVEAVSESHFPAAGEDLSKYGLDRPQLTVDLDQEAFHFGNRHVLKDAYYVLHKETIYIVDAHYYQVASVPYSNVISRRLLEDVPQLTSLQLPEFALKLVDGSWKREPQDPTLSSDQINAFVDEWRHAYALAVDKYSGSAAAQQIRIHYHTATQDTKEAAAATPAPQEQELLIDIIQTQPDLILHRHDEGLEYRFPADVAKRLLQLHHEG